MKKRSFLKSVLLPLILTFVMTGCNANTGQTPVQTPGLDPKNPVMLEIWHYYNGIQQSALDDMILQFNNTVGNDKGIVVQAFSKGNVNQLIEKVMDCAQKKVGSDNMPDIFAAYADTAFQVDQLGLAADLTPYLSQEEIDEYVTAYMDEGDLNGNGELKIFPIAKSSEILMLNWTDWNRFLEESKNETISQEDLKSYEGLVRIGKAYYEWTDSLTPEPNDGKAFFGRDAMANYFIIGCKQMEKDIFKVSNGEVTLQLDKDIIRRLWDNYYTPYIHGWFGSYGRFRSDDAQTGDIISLVGSTSGAAYFPTKVMKSDSESYPIEVRSFSPPVFEGGKQVAVQQGAGMVVSKSNPQTEYAATVFLKWFTESERNIQFSAVSGYLPVKKEANHLETIQNILESSNQTAMQSNLKESLSVSIETVNQFDLYTNKAFSGGTAARAILENSLVEKAKADRQKVLDMITNQTPYEQATAVFTTDENFENWYADFTAQLEEAIN